MHGVLVTIEVCQLQPNTYTFSLEPHGSLTLRAYSDNSYYGEPCSGSKLLHDTHVTLKPYIINTHTNTFCIQLVPSITQSVMVGYLSDYFSIEDPSHQDTRNAYLYAVGK